MDVKQNGKTFKPLPKISERADGAYNASTYPSFKVYLADKQGDV